MKPAEILKRTNKRVMIACVLLILMAISGYIMEYLRGTRSLTYVLLLSSSLIAPIAFSYVFYRLPRFNESFKSIALYSFIFSWMIMLTFSPKVIQFTLIFPLILIYVLYYDQKLIRNASILIFVYGIFKVVLNIKVYGMNDAFMSTEHTVFILSLIAFGLAAVNTVSFSVKIRNQQLESILEEKEKNAILLVEMKSVMDVIQRTTREVYVIYNELIDTSDAAANSIDQLSMGVNEIAKAISIQCDHSEGMQNKLLHTSGKALTVVAHTQHSAGQVHDGKLAFVALDSHADKIRHNNHQLYNKMIELEKDAVEIKTIVDIIQKISVQTNLLALNASIESARAGESGKGFSVVAEAIRELSIRTSESLDGINQRIERLESSASESLLTAEATLETGETIQELIHTTRNIFEEIDSIIEQVNHEITESTKTTEEVVKDNQTVVDHISSITHSVKESAAYAGNVSERMAHNKRLTMKAKAYMDELSKIVERV